MTGELARLRRLSGAPRSRIALSVATSALTVLFGAGLMAASGYLISRAAEHPAMLSLTTTIVAVRFFGLGRPLVRYLDRLVSHDLALRTLAHVRTRVFARIEPLAPAGLEGFRSGDLLVRMVGDVEALQGLYLRGLAPPLAAVCVGALCVTATALVLPAAALVLACGLVIAGVCAPLIALATARSSGRRQATARGALGAELVELLRAAPELVVYGREADALERVRALDAELARTARRDALLAGLAAASSLLFAGLTATAVLATAVAAHDRHALDRVLVASLTLLALASFEAVAPLPDTARELSATLASGRRVLDLCGRSPAVTDPRAPLPAPSGVPDVALERVTARYAASEPAVLEEFDLHLAPGARVALVGPSGAGKTTVANLLLRFLDPEQGRVTVAGRDVREYRQRDLRRTFGLAGQAAHVFDSTIRENLRLAYPGASDDEIRAALGQAQLASWVDGLPDGLDTLVGEDGARLSGGQRQRLVLARALLADAPVLVLDEPTAHLDVETARLLMDDVLAAADGRSLLLITHRSEGLEQMDEIVTLAPCTHDVERRLGP